MKKKVKKIVIIISLIVVLILVYFSFVIPIKMSEKKIDCVLSDTTYCSMKSMEDEVNLEGFNGVFPSKNDADYRIIHVTFELSNRSFLKMMSANNVMSFWGEEAEKYVLYSDVGEMVDGDCVPQRFGKKDITIALYTYVGDLSTDEEILERVKNIIKGSDVILAYNMEWIGNREIEQKIKWNFKEVQCVDVTG